MRHHLLCVGRNLQLQLLRQDFLQAAGYAVDVLPTSAEAILAAGENRYDAVILCDSLAREESDRLAHSLGMVAPTTAVLRLNFLSPPLAEHAPEILLQSVRAILRGTQRRQAARAPLAG